MSISCTVPAAKRAKANAALEDAGHGPDNFSVPLYETHSEQITHYGLHEWDNDEFLASLQALSITGLVIREDKGFVVNFDEHLTEQGLERDLAS